MLNQNCTYGGSTAYEYHEDATRLAVDDHRVEAEKPGHRTRLLLTRAHRAVLCVALVVRRDECRVDTRVVHVPEARLVAHVQQLRVRQPQRIEHTVAVEAGQLPRTARRNDHLPTGPLLEPRHHQRSAIPRLYTQCQ